LTGFAQTRLSSGVSIIHRAISFEQHSKNSATSLAGPKGFLQMTIVSIAEGGFLRIAGC
jgi:hypothetical protein